MIINIRGTGGSGKSTVVREVMARCVSVMPEYIVGRKRPIGYRCLRPSYRQLFVPGHYETPCGGCDTITKPAEVFALVMRETVAGNDVLFEGIIVQDDVNRLTEIHRAGHEVLVLALDVPLEECLEAIRRRRQSRGDKRELNPLNTTNRSRTVRRSMERLKIAGVPSRWETRQSALEVCLARLGLLGEPVRSTESRSQQVLDFGGGE